MEYVSVREIDDDVLKDFASGCSSLHTLIILNHVIKIQGMRNLLEYCPLLNILDINGSSITYDALIELRNLNNLTGLNLESCNCVTDEGIAGLVHESSSLEGISLKYCSNLTDASFASIANDCPQLKSVYMFNFGKFSATGIIFLFNQCKYLALISGYENNDSVPMYILDVIDERCMKMDVDENKLLVRDYYLS